VRFRKSDKIQFISTVEGLESIEDCLPRPAKHFIPQWFKDIPSNANSGSTVKSCPSFSDYFSQGYIVPMWSDVQLTHNDESWEWQTPMSKFSWGIHGNAQFLDYKDASFNGIQAEFVFKADCPWRIITPPGWSVLQLPLFYHFNKEWSVLPGIIDTDIHHEINQQFLYHGNGNPVNIKFGEPVALYIPFKRSNKLKHEILYQTDKHKKLFNMQEIRLFQSLKPNGVYRKLQRKRDKKD
jgi:hypothetical protein